MSAHAGESPLAMTAAARPAPLPPPAPARRFALTGLRVVAIGGAVAALLAPLLRQALVPTLVYSLCITFFCWLFIDGGRLLAARWVRRHEPAGMRSGWPGWGWMAACLLVGTFAGQALGAALASLLLGTGTPGLLGSNLHTVTMLMVISLIPSGFATFYFYSRARLAATQAQAEQAERQAAEHQLKLLESQLEPHMLFNTLANLRVLIALDPPRAQAMLDRLIAFLRATLEASRRGAHPLSAEFARLADYLALMQVRMGARLEVGLDLPPALAALPVPPLLLQPLVENAIKHGLEPKVEGGRLEVSAHREGGRLLLAVRDSGVGLGAAPREDGTRFGLAQVRERLATLYGPAARLTLAPAADDEGGTLATIELPLDAAPPPP